MGSNYGIPSDMSETDYVYWYFGGYIETTKVLRHAQFRWNTLQALRRTPMACYVSFIPEVNPVLYKKLKKTQLQDFVLDHFCGICTPQSVATAVISELNLRQLTTLFRYLFEGYHNYKLACKYYYRTKEIRS